MLCYLPFFLHPNPVLFPSFFSITTYTMENSIPLIDALFRKPSANGSPVPGESQDQDNDQNESLKGQGAQTWKKYGFHQAKNHNANPIALDLELHKLLEQYKKTVHADEKDQEDLKGPLRARIATLGVDVQRITEQAERIRENKIPSTEKQIASIKSEIGDIRRNPEQYREKPSKLGLVLMGIILVLLTVYLWIFYTSASYSAFFRAFKAEDINVANSIFDPRAIANAWEKGAPALVLVVTMPFIFLGLGILMHKFLEEKHWSKGVKLTAVILVTFLFDFIIAYEIVKKIYDLQALNSLEDLPPYRFSMAFSDINFWLIIFAGFVTYLIWGLLFEKFMTDSRKLDNAGEQVRVRQKEIDELSKEVKKLDLEAETLEKTIHTREREKAQAEADLNSVFFRPREVEYVVFHFMSGWMQYIEGGLMSTNTDKDVLRNETRDKVMSFLSDLKPKFTAENA
jgi:uncharacterized membrane protein (DUF106 family)